MGTVLIKKVPVFLPVVFSLFIFGQESDSLKNASGPVILYFKSWQPETRELDGGLRKSEAKNTAHAEVVVAEDGTIRQVNLRNIKGERYLSYYLQWNKKRSWARYWIKAVTDTPLTAINDLFFTHDLSDLRPGYRIVVRDRRNGDIEQVKVYDEIGSFLYFYTFDYNRSERNTETVTSRYFRHDSTLAGYHTLEYDRTGRLRGIDYFDSNGEVRYSLGYQYHSRPVEVSRSIIDRDGNLLEKRVLPLENKYRRRLPGKQSGISLSDAVSFLDNASREDVDALALLLEQRYQREIYRAVDTTFSRIIVPEEGTEIEGQDRELHVQKEQKPSQSSDRLIHYVLTAGSTVMRGNLFGEDFIGSASGELSTARSFRLLFLPSVRPFVSGHLVMFERKLYPGLSMGASIPGRLPFGIPVTLSGSGGWGGIGPEFKAGIQIERRTGLTVGLRLESTLYLNAFGDGVLSGLIQARVVVGF